MSLEGTTSKIDESFSRLIDSSTIDDITASTFFERTIAPWIEDNVEPRMVFNQDTLESWAKTQEVEDVCELSKLENWAKSNGYVHENDIMN